jgi:putative pyruvate formate lyase activating enzyme
VNRSDGETGYCHTGARARVASYNAHFGEEAPLVGHYGSGTIFFSHCNLL